MNVADYSVEISRGIRNLLLGRVLLKADYAAGEAVVKVGNEEAGIPGGYLFRNYTSEGLLVQPAASNQPGAISHQEEVVITSTHALHLIISPASHDYSVAAGSYIAMRTPPVPALRVIYTDPLAVPPDELHERMFPAVAILRPQVTFQVGPSGALLGSYTFTLRYLRCHQKNEDTGAAVFEDTSAIVNLLFQDPYLGGTSENAIVTGVTEPRAVRATTAIVLHFVEIHLTAERTGVYDKF